MTQGKFYQQYGNPKTYPVERYDGARLPPGVPATAVLPISMSKAAKSFTLADSRIALSDFGESFSPAAISRLGRDCHTPLDFRPPEALFEPDTPLSLSADIWSLATAIWDIIGMNQLFSSCFCSEDEFISELVDTLGPLPPEWLAKWEGRGDFLEPDGRRKTNDPPWWTLEQAFADGVQRYRRDDGMGAFSDEESAAILDLMRRMLRFRPEERLTVQQVLESEWMVKWARVDYQRSRSAST